MELIKIKFIVHFIIGTIIHHTQATIVPQSPVPAPQNIQNPVLNRVAAPQIRQSLHMSPAKTSLSHVVIQQRQIVPSTQAQAPPTTPVQPKTITTTANVSTHATTTTTSNIAINRTSTIVVPSSATPKPVEAIDTKPIECEPASTLITQNPQTRKQIVLESKIHQQKIDVVKTQEKPQKLDDSKSSVVVASATVMPSTIKSSESLDEIPPIPATTSVIKNILSNTDETCKIKVEQKDDKSDSVTSALKEDTDYWSAKEVNIESVIKKVDALCTTDDEASVDSKIIVKSENVVKTETVDTENDKNDAKTVDATKTVDTKSQNKREKLPRNKKAPAIENEPQKSPPQPTSSSTPQAAVIPAAQEQTSGVQTRRGPAKPVVQTKRGRNNRNASPRSKASNVPAGSETKPRNNTSESDIYEFHEDSGEETFALQSSEPPTRARALSFSKSHTSMPASPNTQQSQSTEPNKTQTPIVTTTAISTAPAAVNLPEPDTKPTQELPEIEKPASQSIEPSSQQDDGKDDSNAHCNLRKSRRLIERDGSRNTVDDIIEDVVKNASKAEQTVITSTSASAVIQPPTQSQPIASHTPAQTQPPQPPTPRRSTRHTTNQTTAPTTNKLTVNEKIDVRKSPRPTRNAKDQKSTEPEPVQAIDEKIDDSHHTDMQDSKPTDTDSESTQCASETGEMIKAELAKAEQIAAKIEELPKVHTTMVKEPITTTATPIEIIKRPGDQPMTLIDPVTGELTVVQQSNEGQYVPVVSNRGGTDLVNKPQSVLVTPNRPIIETPVVTSHASHVVSKTTTAPVVTIVSKPIAMPTQSIQTTTVQAATPAIPVSVAVPVTSAAVHVQKSTVVITSKAIDLPTAPAQPIQTHSTHASAVPLSMSIEKTLAQPATASSAVVTQSPQIQIQPIVQQPQAISMPQQPHHPIRSHILSAPSTAHNTIKVSQAPVISAACTPVILSTSINASVSTTPHITNVQPVIKSTSIIQSNIAVQSNHPPHKYVSSGKEPVPSVIAQQQSQYQPKIQVSIAQPPQIQSHAPSLSQQQQQHHHHHPQQQLHHHLPTASQLQQQQQQSHLSAAAHKNTLIVNIPSNSPAATHSPRHSPNVQAKVTQVPSSVSMAHESQYSIHVPKHSVVTGMHQPQILSQKPVVIHANKMHMPPTSANYTSVVQGHGKVIQTPPTSSHHLTQPTPMVTPTQMAAVQQPMPMQHISQPPPKSSANHQITIQSTPQYAGSIPLQMRSTSSGKYEPAPSPKFKQHIMPPNLPQIQTTHASIVQAQSAAAAAAAAKQQSSLQQSINNQMSNNISNQIRLHQAAASQIMTGAVASPPPKQPHLNSQQPIVAGKKSIFSTHYYNTSNQFTFFLFNCFMNRCK